MPTIPKVAVITRTKDRPVLLERALRSVHSQTMTDFVHVVINDAGDPKVIDSLLKKHQDLTAGRVRVIHNNASNGMEAASNKAIKSVNSTYIAIHDDDDTWHKDFLKQTTEYLDKRTDIKGAVVVTDKVDEKIIDNEIKTLSVERWLPEAKTINLYKQCLDNYVTPITFLYKREVFSEIGYYDEDLPVAGDWDFALRFLLKYDIDFIVTDYALAFYHHRPTATGVNQNSVFVDKGLLHEQKINAICNKFLREELNSGKLGLGYIISSLRLQEEKSKSIRNSIFENVEQKTVRLEGHINLRDAELRDFITRKINDFLLPSVIKKLLPYRPPSKEK
jgi:glycosyltransferase involved in cell wall biosynthesis